jgi:hypothetical protein
MSMNGEVHHTWLFQPGQWIAEGLFWERGEVERRGRGHSIVRHESERWVIEGEMEILADPVIRFRNVYDIAPPKRDARAVPWQSENPSVGRLTGTFVVVGASIMSLFQSADRVHLGSECLTQLDARRYQACGVFRSNDAVISTWSMTLSREA